MMWRRSLAMRLAPGDHQDGLLLQLALELVDAAVAGDRRLGELGIALLQRVEALRQQPLGQPAHLRDLLVEQLQLLVERPDDVLALMAPPSVPVFEAAGQWHLQRLGSGRSQGPTLARFLRRRHSKRVTGGDNGNLARWLAADGGQRDGERRALAQRRGDAERRRDGD